MTPASCRSPMRETAKAVIRAALATQPGAVNLPAGYRVEVVSDFDVRVYGPDNETWLIQEGDEGTFSNFVYRMMLAVTPSAPTAVETDELGVQSCTDNILTRSGFYEAIARASKGKK